MTNATRLYARLISLRDKAGETHFERISLAAQLLTDRGWVEDPQGGGGDEGKALDRLEAECFGDICGLISLPRLLEVYAAVPDVEDWRRAKFNLPKIWAAYQAARRPTARAGSRGPREPAGYLRPDEFPELTEGQKRKEYERVYRAYERDESRIARLEAENARLREELDALKAWKARFQEAMAI